jgi:hypothetical protein
MIYCFDTSALNRLFDDSERDSIVHGLLDTGSFYISAYNVIEVAKIPDETRRTALVQLMKRLADNKRPLDRPNTIVLSHATAHAAGKSRATVNADSNLEGLWIALNQPELIDDDARHEVVAWTKEVEGDFSKVVAGDRDMFQKFFQDVPTERPLNASFTLRTYLNQTSECRSLISDVYHRHTGTALTDSGYDKCTSPHGRSIFSDMRTQSITAPSRNTASKSVAMPARWISARRFTCHCVTGSSRMMERNAEHYAY